MTERRVTGLKRYLEGGQEKRRVREKKGRREGKRDRRETRANNLNTCNPILIADPTHPHLSESFLLL